MHKTQGRKRTTLAFELSALTLALAAMAPLPAAMGVFSAVAEARAQTNPCAPQKVAPANPCAPKKVAPANPCAPRKAAPTNPCAPRKAAPANPCAPQKVAPSNPCAPKKAAPTNPCAPQAADRNAIKAKTSKENCKHPVNPCAPIPGCDNTEPH